MSVSRSVLPAAIVALVGVPALASHCTPVFDLSLGTPGPVSGFSNLVTKFYASDAVTPGSNLLYVGGTFDSIGGVVGTGSIAAWNGSSFAALGTGVRRVDIVGGTPTYSTADVNAAIAFNGAIYIGGQLDGTAEGIVSRGAIRWTGSTFESVNNVDPDVGVSVVNAFAVYNGELYAGGNFTLFGTATTNAIAKYVPGTNDWVAVDGGTATTGANVTDMLVFNDGSGDKLYAVGNFLSMGTAASPSTKHIARFNGTAWEPVGTGYLSSGPSAFPRDILVFDDGYGPALYSAGGLAIADPTLTRSSINKWDGTKWTAMPGFTSDPAVTAVTVNSMGLYNDGTGTTIYAQARFFGPSIGARQVIVRLENGQFEEVPNTSLGTGSIFEFYQHNDGSGTKLFIGGSFTEVGGAPANRIGTITGCNPATSACPADFNNSGAVSVQDIFDFLAAYFAGCP